MPLSIIRDIASSIRDPKYFTIMADETAVQPTSLPDVLPFGDLHQQQLAADASPPNGNTSGKEVGWNGTDYQQDVNFTADFYEDDIDKINSDGTVPVNDLVSFS
eukprot:Em0008g530a